jgi:hypothetical protein
MRHKGATPMASHDPPPHEFQPRAELTVIIPLGMLLADRSFWGKTAVLTVKTEAEREAVHRAAYEWHLASLGRG